MLERDTSFLALLIDKLAYTKKIEEEIGKPTNAAQKKVWRQIDQISIKKVEIQ